MREIELAEHDIAIATLDDDNDNIAIAMRAADIGVERTGLILDDSDIAFLINRELVYTAITRAKKTITIFSDKKTWDTATSRSSNRISGMLEHVIDLKSRKKLREIHDT